MVFGLRWIEWLEIGYEIHEDFIGLYECKNTTGEHLTFAAEDILLMNDLKLINCRGQNYDGAGSMQGKNSGVKSRILKRKIEPCLFGAMPTIQICLLVNL